MLNFKMYKLLLNLFAQITFKGWRKMEAVAESSIDWYNACCAWLCMFRNPFSLYIYRSIIFTKKI